jgi:hypothetical protein
MKKLMIAALAFVATTTGAMAAEMPNLARASIELAKNGVSVSNFDLSVLEGNPTNVSNVVNQAYVTNCTPGEAGGTSVSTTTLTTGMTAQVTALDVTAKGTLFAVAFNYSELIDVKQVQLKSCRAEVPSSQSVGKSMTVFLKPGEPVELVSTIGKDKYVFTVRDR